MQGVSFRRTRVTKTNSRCAYYNGRYLGLAVLQSKGRAIKMYSRHFIVQGSLSTCVRQVLFAETGDDRFLR